jgi:hypothetical protein
MKYSNIEPSVATREKRNYLFSSERKRIEMWKSALLNYFVRRLGKKEAE